MFETQESQGVLDNPCESDIEVTVELIKISYPNTGLAKLGFRSGLILFNIRCPAKERNNIYSNKFN
ncbi:hypothetical protein ACJX0J_019650, partial [Zea mays]